MHMDSPNYLCECGTTHTRHFVRVMLVDFHCIICQRCITGLFSSSMHNTMLYTLYERKELNSTSITRVHLIT